MRALALGGAEAPALGGMTGNKQPGRVGVSGLLRGIGPRLLVHVLLFSSVVTFVLTAAQLFLDYQGDIRDLERRFEDIDKVIAPSLAESLWKIDRRQIDVQLAGLLQIPDFLFAEIVESGPAPLSITHGKVPAHNVMARDFLLRCNCGGDGEKVIGSLRVAASLDRIYGNLIQRALVILGSQGVKTFVVSFFILWVFHFLVTRHLTAAANAMAEGRPIRLERKPLKTADELEGVAGAFNALLDSQQTALAEKATLAEHYASIVDNLPGNVVRLHYFPDGRRKVLFMAGTSIRRELFGKDIQDLTHEEYISLFHPDDHHLVFTEVPRRLRDTGYSEQRYRIRLPGNAWQWRWTRERVIERRDDGSFVTEALAIDISEEMEAKSALNRSEQLFRTVVGALPVGLVVIDVYGKVIVYNEAAVAIWGRRPAPDSPHWLNKTWTYPDGSPLPQDGQGTPDWVLGPDGVPLALDRQPMTQARLRGEVIRGFEMQVRQPDGKIVPLMAYPSPLHDAEGRVIGAFNIMIDVTEAKRYEEELRSRQREYRTLIDNAPILVVRYDTNLNRKFVNKAWQALSGIPFDDAVAKHPAPLLQVDAYAAKLRETLESGTSQTIEFAWTRPDGAVLQLEYTIVPEIDENGATLGVLSVGHDITERTHLEEERVRLAERDDAMRRWEALGQLAGGIAHDFNNLLGAIMGYAEFIVEDAKPNDDVVVHARRILSAGKRGRELVSQILTFSRSRRSEIRRTKFPLASVVDEIRHILEVAVPSSTRMAFDLEQGDAQIEGDWDQMGQLILNLAINASDALNGNPGDVAVEVRPPALTPPIMNALSALTSETDIKTWTDPGNSVHAVLGKYDPSVPSVALIVRDQGTGMDEACMRQIFTPFFTTKDKGQGTGLGLAVVQGVVRSHDAALAVESRLGEGTSFMVILPVASWHGERRRDLHGRKRQDTASTLASVRILLVDDDADFRAMLDTALKRKGGEVSAYSDPLDALEAVRQDPAGWDALVTDQTMPGMRGTDLIREVKAIRPGLPCLLCTGYDGKLIEDGLPDGGADALFHKPIDIKALLKALSRYIGR